MAPRVHADRGTIRFAFSGTHLATFDGFAPRLHLWTELRSPLANPVGKRTVAIQPDLTLLADPITARHSPLVVECKQYKRASTRNFADALSDYAHGHPDARIVLVNYGRAQAARVLDRVAPDIVLRTAVVGDFRPGTADQVEQFRREVRTAVGLARFDDGVPARITLRWSDRPRDLDLHVRIGDEARVSYQNRGALDEYPYCALDEDITKGVGPEVISIARWLPATYFLVVHNFSNDGTLGESKARVTLERGSEVREFQCPAEMADSEWLVCEIDGRTGAVTETH
jgi:hypothetical protein